MRTSFCLVIVGVLLLSLLAGCAQPAPTAAPTKPAAPAVASPVPTGAAPAGAATKPAAAAATAAPAAAATPAAKIKRGGTLRVAIQNDFMNLWPLLTTGPTAAMIYDPLVHWRRNKQTGQWGPVAALAESWEMKPSEAVFKLRKGVKFHDGSDWNAQVAKWNFDQFMNNPKSTPAVDLECIDKKNPATVVDDYTVKVNLVYACAPLLAILSDGQSNTTTLMASKAAFDKGGDEELQRRPVGTGPFAFSDRIPQDHMTVKRQESYWRMGDDGKPLPYVDGANYRFIPDDSVRMIEVRSGNQDLTALIQGKDIPAVKTNPDLQFLELPWMARRYRFLFNSKTEPFGTNLKLRQAAQYAIDRESLAKVLGAGAGLPTKYDLTAGNIGYDESLPYYGYDPAKAKQLVTESGNPNGVDITITVISRELDTRQAQMMKQMLDAVGIRTTIEAMERIAWGTKVREAGNYQMATQATGTTHDPDPLLTLAWASEGRAVYTRAVVPEMDKCLQEGRSTYDVKQRDEIYKRCQKIMYDTAWWGFAWMQYHNYVLNKKVKNFQDVWGDIRQEESIWLDQ